jgi:hypothetical protein
MVEHEFPPGMPDESAPAYTEQPLPHREKARRSLLWFLGVGLVVTIVGRILLATFAPTDRLERIMDICQTVCGMLSGAFLVAVGYYFQSEAKH